MKQVHPLDRQRKTKRPPKTHHSYRSEKTDGSELPNALWLARPSWRALRLNLFEIVKLAVMVLIPLALAVGCRFMALSKNGTAGEPIFNGLVGVFLFATIGMLIAVMPSFALIQIHSARREAVDYWDEFIIGLPLMWRFLGVTLITSITTAVGLTLFILPGLFAMQRWYLAPYYVIDREYGVREALRASAAVGRKYKRPMWGLAVLIFVTRLTTLIPAAGIILGPVLQLIYGFAPAVRYVEVRHLEDRS